MCRAYHVLPLGDSNCRVKPISLWEWACTILKVFVGREATLPSYDTYSIWRFVLMSIKAVFHMPNLHVDVP